MSNYEEVGFLEFSSEGKLLFSNNIGEKILNELYEMNIKCDLSFILSHGENNNIIKTFKGVYAFGVIRNGSIKVFFIPINSKLNSIENHIDTTSFRHEIKNPLAAIYGVVQVMELKYTDSYLKKCFEIIKSECSRINNLMININFISDMQLDLKRTDIIALLNKSIEKFKIVYPEISISFIVDDSIRFVNIDAEKIEMALNNILKNAFEAEGTTHLSIGYFLDPVVKLKDKEKSVFKKMVKFSIRDNGRGMDENTVKRLFTPFYTTKNKGSGLGLVISKEIVERHGGKIEYKTLKGEGTEFLLYLPV